MTRDPFAGFVGSPGSLHRYGYVGNNPATLADPSGRCPVVAAALAGAAAGSAVPGPGTATGAAGSALVAFGFCLFELTVEALVVNEVAGDPLEIRRDPLPPPIPARDPRFDPGFLTDTLFGVPNPFTGEPQPPFRLCGSLKCRVALAALGAIFTSIFAIGNAQASGAPTDMGSAPRKSRVLSAPGWSTRYR